MLEDLSQHVLDIAENSVAAEATAVLVEINEDRLGDMLSMVIEDNGKGMTPDFLEKATNPFTTTRTTRRIGMGLPFLKQSTELCGGNFILKSAVGVGTRTEASFKYSSIDRPPMGDMPSTVMALIMGHPEIDWIYRHLIDGREFSVSSLDLVEVLEDRELLRTTEVGLWVRDQITEGIAELEANQL